MIKLLKNMKIKSKLFLGFCTLIAGLIFISIFASNGKLNMQLEAEYVLDGPFVRYSLGRDIDRTFLEARRLMNRISMHGGANIIDQQGIDNEERAFHALRQDMTRLIAEYRHSMNTVNVATQETINERHRLIDSLVSDIEAYWVVIGQVITFARAADLDSALEATVQATTIVADVNAQLDELMSWSTIFMDSSSVYLADYANTAILTMWIVAISVAIIGLAFALIISSLITKPIREVLIALGDVSKGNLNVNIDRSNLSNDEIGVLTQDVCGLIDIIKNMVADLSNAHKEYIQLGHIHFTIDDSKYQNSFKEMVGLINNLLTQVAADITEVASILDDIGDGNFEREFNGDVWVGEWVVMPNAISKLISNIKGVNAEVNAMIEAAAERGELHFQIDASKYNGSWSKIIEGLDHIAKAVDAPIVEIMNVMNKLSKGDFTNKVTGDYKGDFLQIKNAVNETINILEIYIAEITGDLAAISSGDLTTVLTREYVGSFGPIKESLNDISETLHKTMSEISVASEQVLVGAKQISSSAMDLASGAQEQASSVQELNASIDMISQQTRQNADSALTANALSGKSTANAQEGNVAMKQMVEAMTQIKESSNDISEIVQTIQDIAFQTNLLALNASVEAARAGEHGKGFAVVADEVRTLAGRSQNAATQTTELIQDSISRVGTGSNIAKSTSESLDAIVASANEVLAVISSISEASKEQAEAIGQVSVGVEQISKVVQSNSAVSEETAASAEELSSQSELLRQLVSYFKL